MRIILVLFALAVTLNGCATPAERAQALTEYKRAAADFHVAEARVAQARATEKRVIDLIFEPEWREWRKEAMAACIPKHGNEECQGRINKLLRASIDARDAAERDMKHVRERQQAAFERLERVDPYTAAAWACREHMRRGTDAAAVMACQEWIRAELAPRPTVIIQQAPHRHRQAPQIVHQPPATAAEIARELRRQQLLTPRINTAPLAPPRVPGVNCSYVHPGFPC